MISSRLVFGLAIALAACTSIGCSDDDDNVTPTPVVDTGVPVDTGTTPADTSTPADTAVEDTGTPADTAGPTTHEVSVGSGGNSFSPASLTIKVGDTVHWTWAGDAHTVTQVADTTSCTAMSGGFTSPLQNTGATFSQTFTTAGTVNYVCTVHCALGMRGTITVTP